MPPVRPSVELVEVDGAVLVVAEIAAMPSDQQPCYVQSRGIAIGSFVRVGDAPRFEDNPVIRGAIPDLVAETVLALRRHMNVRSYVNGTGRREQTDYPLDAVREAIVNAVLHRDYSNVTRGTPQRAYHWVGTG